MKAVAVFLMFFSVCNPAAAIEDIDVGDVSNFGNQLLGKTVRLRACAVHAYECLHNEGYYCVNVDEVDEKSNSCRFAKNELDTLLISQSVYSFKQIKSLIKRKDVVRVTGEVALGNTKPDGEKEIKSAPTLFVKK